MALEKIPTGVEQLDQVLGGGIPVYATILISGLPGSGKTVLAEQILFHNARQGRRGLFLTTLSEPQLKVLRYLSQFSFFDANLFGKQVHYYDIGTLLREKGFEKTLQAIDQLIKEHRPQIVVVDSFKALRNLLGEEKHFPEFVFDFALQLAVWECTSLLVGEYTEEELSAIPEAAIVDGVIYLYGTTERKHQKRFLRILKMRGCSYFSGEHMFRITSRGIVLHPRMSPSPASQYLVSSERCPFGIPGLDQMTYGGVYRGSSTLIVGPSGSGKTTLALSFLVEGARKGEPGLMVCFEEAIPQLVMNAQDRGWDLPTLMEKGHLEILRFSPSELDIDECAFAIKEAEERIKARRVAIDGLMAFGMATPDREKFRSYLWTLADYFKSKGISLILTSDVGSSSPLRFSEEAISFMADNILLLRYFEGPQGIKRGLSLIKMRGSPHDTSLRELVITDKGILVGEPIDLHFYRPLVNLST